MSDNAMPENVTSEDTLLRRLQGVRQALPEKEIDALLLTDIGNIGYVTGFTGSTAYALITGREAVFMTDGRYTLRAQKECPQFTVIPAGAAGYLKTLMETLEARPDIRKIGFEASKVTVATWEHFKKEAPATVEWVATENIVEDLRLVKDAGEIAAIRRAIETAEAAFVSVRPLLRPGVTEREVALELEFAMRRGGADKEAFETIVASGAQGAHPHHSPNGRPLAAGDLVTIDWGASVNSYNSDITRTVAIGGAPLTDKQREVYQIVLDAQRQAIAAIAPGKNGQEIDAVARDYMSSHGYGEAFAHSLGHSLGRHVHDGPGLSTRGEKLILRPGMVMTVEPGIYLENWGGVRIEEDVLVTDTGHEILTHLPNELETLG